MFISATQISEIHRVMCQEIRAASFKLWDKIFNKNKTTAVPPVDAAAAFVLVQPNHLVKICQNSHLATFSQTCSTHRHTPESIYSTAELSSTWFP